MLISTNSYAKTTESLKVFDVFSDAFSSMKITGSILFNEEYAAPWAIAVPDAERLREILKLRPGAQVVAFHFVQRGHIEIALENKKPVIIEAGELAICFGGAAHRISLGSAATVIPVEALLNGGENPFQPEERQPARSTSLICGIFLMHNVELNPLFATFPPLLHASTIHPGGFNHLSMVLERMAEEINHQTFGSAYVVERLLELLCAEALRAHLASVPPQATGWLNGVRDPLVGRAIAMIHAQPGERWSVKYLAERVAMSPSRFAARFVAALGESPMAYVTKWRMNVASRLLGSTQRPVSEIATDVGYENLAAFSRAFKRHIGVPPAAWRSSQAS